MKGIIFLIIFSLIVYVGVAQLIPMDSLYLGQIPPKNTPKIFNLSASIGFHAIENITISNDGKSIFYLETNGYDSASINRIKYYSYESNKWTGPFVLFENLSSPSLSVTGDTIYFSSKYSVKNQNVWTEPKSFSTKIPYWHYLQRTNSGTYYASMKDVPGKIGKNDWSKININKTDTIITSLGSPINTAQDDLDFYISKDESYIIFASDHAETIKYGYSDLYISYRKNDNTWTTPINLGININDPTEARWGPFVSTDNKYLFYSRGSKPDYSDSGTNWVRIDNIIDSLKTTNY